MTVELRTLRISPNLDSSKYVTSARQIDAANAQMSASGREVGVVISDNTAKISTAVDNAERLRRTYIDGYGTAAKFSSELNRMNKLLDTGRISTKDAELALSGMYRRFGLVAEASEATARGYHALGGVIDSVNAKLRTQQAEAARSAALMQSLGEANDNSPHASGAQFRRQNLGYQLFDVVQSGYGGMNASMIAAQQLPQIIQLYAGQGGLNAALKDTFAILGGAVRVMGPLIAGGAAAYGVFQLLQSHSAAAAIAVDEVTAGLAAQAAPASTIESRIGELTKIQNEWTAAIRATASAYSAASMTIAANSEKEYSAKRDLLQLELKRQEASIAAQKAEIALAGLQLKGDVARTVTTIYDPERQGFADPNIGRFTTLPESITALQRTQELLASNPLTGKITEMQANLSLTEIAAQKLKDALGGMGSAARDQVGGISALKDVLEELSKMGTPVLSEMEKIEAATQRGMEAIRGSSGILHEEARRRLLIAQGEAQRRLESQNPTVINGDGQRVAVPVPGARPQYELEGDGSKSSTAYEKTILSARRRIDQIRIENDMIGQSKASIDSFRFKMDLLNQSSEDGVEITAKQRAEIMKLGEEFAPFSETVASPALVDEIADFWSGKD